MLACLGLAVYTAAAYRFAHARLSDRLAECDTLTGIFAALAGFALAPATVPAGYGLAVACRLRCAAARARRWYDSENFS